MTRGRLRVAAAVAAALVLGAAPAGATISAPANNSVVNADPTLVGSIDVGRSASGVTLTLEGPGGSMSLGGGCGAAGVSCSGNVVSFDVPVSLDVNGTYSLTAVGYHTATSPLDRSTSTAPESSSFGLEEPPRAPRRLAAEPDGARRTVDLSWTSNNEPDLLGYQVVRSVDGGPAEARANVPPASGNTVTYVDDAAGGGRLTYQVLAVRRGATAERFVAGPLSSPATATIDAAPTPTTTTPAAGGGSGGEGGRGSTDGGTAAGETSGGQAAPGGLRPTATATPVVIKPGSTLDLSGFTPNPPPPRPTATPAPGDPGYQELLPYKSKAEPGDDPVVGESALPTERVTETGSSENRKALLTFLAGAMVLFMTSMHLRWLLRRVAPVT